MRATPPAILILAGDMHTPVRWHRLTGSVRRLLRKRRVRCPHEYTTARVSAGRLHLSCVVVIGHRRYHGVSRGEATLNSRAEHSLQGVEEGVEPNQALQSPCFPTCRKRAWIASGSR